MTPDVTGSAESDDRTTPEITSGFWSFGPSQGLLGAPTATFTPLSDEDLNDD